MIIIDRNNPIDEDNGWLLLERQTINDRTLLCWYSPNTNQINISLFNLLEKPNALSKKSNESQWGFMTHYVKPIQTDIEATEVVNLCIKDLYSGNYWWEGNPTH